MSSSPVDPTEIQLLVFEKRRWKFFGDNAIDCHLMANVAGTNGGTNGDRHQVKVFDDFGLKHSIDIRSIKKCVIRKKTWIELTDKRTNQRLALNCLETDPNFISFSGRLITLFQLLKVKFSLKDTVSKYPRPSENPILERAMSNDYKEPPEDETPSTIKRPLPPVPPTDPSEGGSPLYDYTIGCRGNRNLPDLPGGGDGRREEEGGGGGYLIPNPERECTTLQLESRVRSKSNSERTNTLPVSHPRRSLWSCSSCTLENHLSDSHCRACGSPRNSTTSKVKKKVNGAECHRVHQPSPPVACPPSDFQVQKWRCQKCTFMNSSDAFTCGQCMRMREDAWECHICNDVISHVVVWCRRCDVWRCQLCHVQNDATENDSRCCKTCGQIRV